MQMFHEKTLDVRVATAGCTYDSRLYVRLSPDARVDVVSLDTQAPNAALSFRFPLAEPGAYPWIPLTLGHALAKVVFPSLPGDVSISLKHSPRFWLNGTPASFASVQETMSSGPADDDDCHTVQFQLRVDGIDPRVGRNRTWLATHDDDFGFCVHNFARAEGVAFETCAFCRLADTPHFGGADWRFGLYCFRDAPEEQERLRREPSDEVWNSVAWSHVDAFHTCPSFEMAPHWLEPRKPEATAAPGPDPTEKS